MTYYKAIVTMKNGVHKIVRLTYLQVAHVVSEVRKFNQNIFRDVVEITLNGVTLCLNEILSWRIFNEYTREEFLTLS